MRFRFQNALGLQMRGIGYMHLPAGGYYSEVGFPQQAILGEPTILLHLGYSLNSLKGVT